MNRVATILNTAAPVNIKELTTSPVALSPLARPLRRLAEDLNGHVRYGQLQGVELDLKHLDCPCFLLRVAPNKPQFYVELFRGDLDNAFDEDEEVPLCVLMNWLGSDTEPAFWETDWAPDFGEEPDFGEVLSHILFMIAAQQTETQKANVRKTSPHTVIK